MILKIVLLLVLWRYFTNHIPANIDIIVRIRKMKNRIFAISAALAAMPVNPKTAAISAMIKNTIE